MIPKEKMSAISVSKSKIGGRKILHSQSREIVRNVFMFMKEEAEKKTFTDLNRVQERVQKATGVSISSIKRIIKESAGNSGNILTPKRRKKGIQPKSGLDDFDLSVVRRTINEFHITNKERPTVKSLRLVLKEKIIFQGSDFTLRKIMRNMGYRWRKSENNRLLLTEKMDIRNLRINYLRKLKQYRAEGRPFFFMDETYIHSTHTKPKSWSVPKSAEGLKTPISKGSRLIIVHAGNENGFVEGAMLAFMSGKKTGDYHDDMNFQNYEKWISEKLIPNLPEKSVLVIDNAPYHNVQLNRAPTSASRKADMIDWLSKQNIPFSETMLKPQLYTLIQLHKPRHKTFKIDSILAESGHSTLRLPPYHPDLNPIELVWSWLKDRVAKRNVNFSMGDVLQIVNEECGAITDKDWRNCCNHSRSVENNYLELEPIFDRATEEIVINLNDVSSSDESDNSSSDIESDGSLSGFEDL